MDDKELTYEQAQEGIAKRLYWQYMGFDNQWNSPLSKASKNIQEEMFARATVVLGDLFTPKQIEEWKKGGYPAIVCKDQSLPDNAEKHVFFNGDMAYKEGQKDMSDRVRVVKEE